MCIIPKANSHLSKAVYTIVYVLTTRSLYGTVQQGVYMGPKEFIWDSLYNKEFIWDPRSLYGTQGVYMGPTVQQGVYMGLKELYMTHCTTRSLLLDCCATTTSHVYGIGVKQAVFIGLAKFVLHIN